MAIITALLGMLGRFAGKVLTTTLGWASVRAGAACRAGRGRPVHRRRGDPASSPSDAPARCRRRLLCPARGRLAIMDPTTPTEDDP